MSLPLSICQIFAAAKGDRELAETLADRAKSSIGSGSVPIIPCSHHPRCTLPMEMELEKLFTEHPALARTVSRKRP